MSEWGSWDEDRDHKFVVGLTVTPDERLAWLEEMLVLAFERGTLPRQRDVWGRTSGGSDGRDGGA
ncbi:MAG: hypothetical protein KF901_13175 [Myxococcales bacterium]|nr:hypothetical protein [Myxococcales bacterium]